MVLSCDQDWHDMCAREVEHRIPGKWMFVADADRVFSEAYHGRPQRPLIRKANKGGGYSERQVTAAHELPTMFIDYTPHLGLVRPRFDPPAWGPHISMCRGEQPQKNQQVWDAQARLGAAVQAVLFLRSAQAQQAEKTEAYATTATGPKERQNLVVMQDHSRQLTGRLTQAEKTWAQLRDRVDTRVPEFLREDATVEFEFEPDLRLGHTHWYLKVRCPQVPGIRRFYGLTDYPKVPLHLTVGVVSG